MGTLVIGIDCCAIIADEAAGAQPISAVDGTLWFHWLSNEAVDGSFFRISFAVFMGCGTAFVVGSKNCCCCCCCCWGYILCCWAPFAVA